MVKQKGVVRLRTWLVVCFAIFVMAPAFLLGFIYTSGLKTSAEAVVLASLRDRGALSANQLGRRIHRLWTEVARLSTTVELDDREALRARLQQIIKVDNRFTWLGVATVDGRIVAGSERMLEGEDVSLTRWFRQGLHGPFAGDVHETSMLSKVLPNRAEPYRFVDFSAPIHDRDGKTVAVVGAHFDWSWVRDALNSLSQGETEVLLLDHDGRVLYQPEREADGDLRPARGAAQKEGAGALGNGALNHPDYITVRIPEIHYADLPTFGWSLLVRQKIDSAYRPFANLARHFWLTLCVGVATTIAGAILLAYWIVRPLQRLSLFANDLADLRLKSPPPEENGYLEAALLSNALTKLQSMLLSGGIGAQPGGSISVMDGSGRAVRQAGS